MLKTIKITSSTIRTYWRPILVENLGAVIAAILAIPIAFLADYMSSNDAPNPLGDASYLIALLLILVVYFTGVYFETRKFIIYNRTRIHLPVVINIANSIKSQEALSLLAQSLTTKLKVSQHYLSELERYLAITSDDLVFQCSLDISNSDQLYDVLAILRQNLTRLQFTTPKEHTLEIAYIGPVAIGVWLGAMTHTKSIALWPYNRGAGPSYAERIEVPSDLRDNIKKHNIFTRKTRKKITYPQKTDARKWLVALDLSGKPRIQPQHLNELQDCDNCLYISGTHDPVNILPHQYIQYAQEIYSEINALKHNYSATSIRLISCMPNILAILVGRMLGTRFPVEVTHYDSESNTYSVLFKLNNPRFGYPYMT